MTLSPQVCSMARRGIVEAAQARIGVKEDGPPYDNCGREVDVYLGFVGLGPGNPWCLAFAEYCVDLGMQSAGLSFADTTLEKTGYCPAAADRARKLGVLMSAEDVAAGKAIVRPGDIVLVWECAAAGSGQTGYHHSGVVEVAPLTSGQFYSIEGNTNSDGGAEGYIVARQIRSLSSRAPDSHDRYAFIGVM